MLEVLIAMALLGLAGTLSARVLGEATRSVEEAELGLRAAIYLSELSSVSASVRTEIDSVRATGPGVLVRGPDPPNGLMVRYVPPASRLAEGGLQRGGVGGYRRPHSWSLRWDR